MKNTNFTYNMNLTQMFYFNGENQEFRLFTLKGNEKILVAKIPVNQFRVISPDRITISHDNRSMIIEDHLLDLLVKVEMPMPFDIKRGRVVEITDISDPTNTCLRFNHNGTEVTVLDHKGNTLGHYEMPVGEPDNAKRID